MCPEAKRRVIHVRIGAGRALCESGDAQTLGDGGSKEAVVLLRFFSESEEGEEDGRAKDGTPSIDFKVGAQKLIGLYLDPGVLVCAVVHFVGLIPGDPWVDDLVSWGHNTPNG